MCIQQISNQNGLNQYQTVIVLMAIKLNFCFDTYGIVSPTVILVRMNQQDVPIPTIVLTFKQETSPAKLPR